jgi:hypothetical protein
LVLETGFDDTRPRYWVDRDPRLRAVIDRIFENDTNRSPGISRKKNKIALHLQHSFGFGWLVSGSVLRVKNIGDCYIAEIFLSGLLVDSINTILLFPRKLLACYTYILLLRHRVVE